VTIPRLHVVTDDDIVARADFVQMAADVLAAGGEDVALHVRGPRSSGRALFESVSSLVREGKDSGAWIVVNDRVDVAVACGVTRVHLGRRSLGVSDARAVMGTDSTIGSSCHSAEEVAAAAKEGADFVFMGTLFGTPSHPDAEELGVGAISHACTVSGGMPVMGIGGIGVDRVNDVLQAGAHGVAVVRSVWNNEDPVQAVGHFLDALRPVPTGGA
jgi:thiamine-phosphate pyrophosphorylase